MNDDEEQVEAEPRHGMFASYWADQDEDLQALIKRVNAEVLRIRHDDSIVSTKAGMPEPVPVGDRLVWVYTAFYTHACQACLAEGKGPIHKPDALVDDDGAEFLRKLYELGGDRPFDPRD